MAEGFLLAVSRSFPCSGHIKVASVAAGSFGFGAYFQDFCFFGQWVAPQLSQSIAYKELFPVVVAARVCGSQWSQKHVLFHSDNEAVVHMLKTSRTLSCDS